MILDTNGDIFPEGTYHFRVTDVPAETDIKGYKGWQFSFEAETEEGPRSYSERFMVWLLAPLMRGLGFPEVTPGKFDWEPAAALNREFTATVQHVTLEKGASKGKTVARMTQIVPASGKSTPQRAALNAQAPTGEEIPF